MVNDNLLTKIKVLLLSTSLKVFKTSKQQDSVAQNNRITEDKCTEGQAELPVLTSNFELLSLHFELALVEGSFQPCS